MNWKGFFSQRKNMFAVVAVISFLVSEIVFVSYDYFDNQSANISKAVPMLTAEPLCDNHDEAEEFEKPVPIVWTAKMDGCLVSCEGASFTRVPEDKKYPRFAGYYPAGLQAELEQNDRILKIYGDWIGIGADHPFTVFDNKCVPVVNINKIEVIK